jgi:hypothetical protein
MKAYDSECDFTIKSCEALEVKRPQKELNGVEHGNRPGY